MNVHPKVSYFYQRSGLNRTSKIAIAALCLLITGCTVPEHMEVRAGKDPRNADDDVRFRTTYYFRVFDACRGIGDESAQANLDEIIPETDSLYRYRMTGKAFSLFTNVHFESGTLKSYEIDPFGANVVYDQKNNRFHFKSRSQTEAEAAREDDFNELQRLIDLYSNYKNSKTISEPALDKINTLIELKLDEIAGRKIDVDPRPVTFSSSDKINDFEKSVLRFAAYQGALANTTNKVEMARLKRKMDDETRAMYQVLRLMETAMAREVATMRFESEDKEARKAWATHISKVEALKSLNGAKNDEKILRLVTAAVDRLTIASAVDVRSIAGTEAETKKYGATALPPQLCPPGKIQRRGFQVLGPEGWRTFNQDERLMLAMSSSGKPLISALKSISDRVLNEQDSQSDVLLPLVQERLTISKTRRTLDKIAAEPPPKEAPANELQAMVGKVIKSFSEK